jgi:UDP-glucose 4-epimerase
VGSLGPDSSEGQRPDLAELDGTTLVVTGGCGFIGSHLVRRLSELPVARLVILDDLRNGSRDSLAGLDDRVELRTVPLDGTAPDLVREAVHGADYLLHLAALKHNDPESGAEEVLKTNVLGTFHLFEAAARARVRRIVFSSSLYAYGRTAGAPMSEDEPALPTTVYGTTKLAGERLLYALGREGGPAFNSLRYFFAYGPGRSDESPYRSVITLTFDRLLRGERAVVHGDGQQILDYIFVGDVVEATIRALTSEVTGEVLNVCSGKGVRVLELLRQIQQAAGREGDPIDRAPADATDGTSRVGDPAKCSYVLRFRAATSLSEGLAATFEAASREGQAASR